MGTNNKPKITLFYCINSFVESAPVFEGCTIKTIKMACSSMVKDIFLLKAFEAGADAVLVFACPEKQCRYVEGGIRARKRIEWTKHLLDEIGIDSRRLAIFNTDIKDQKAAGKIIRETIELINELGPNPAA